jgi:hypothetical protein
MSVIPLKADIRQREWHVRLVPQLDIVAGVKTTRAWPRSVADFTLLLVASQPKTSEED